MEPGKDYNLEVGLRIREIRETYQMSRAVFSEKCDISESFLVAVESGRKGVTAKTLYKICSAMNISADYFVRGHDSGFEADTILEIINQMDKRAKEGAMRILQEYADVVYQLSPKDK